MAYLAQKSGLQFLFSRPNMLSVPLCWTQFPHVKGEAPPPGSGSTEELCMHSLMRCFHGLTVSNILHPEDVAPLPEVALATSRLQWFSQGNKLRVWVQDLGGPYDS